MSLDSSTELKSRIADLKLKIHQLEIEIKILKGKLKNRDLEKDARIVAENQTLSLKAHQLKLAVWSILDAQNETHSEALKSSLIDFCKNHKLNPELWKNLES
jgi:hypothetical protein